MIWWYLHRKIRRVRRVRDFNAHPLYCLCVHVWALSLSCLLFLCCSFLLLFHLFVKLLRELTKQWYDGIYIEYVTRVQVRGVVTCVFLMFDSMLSLCFLLPAPRVNSKHSLNTDKHPQPSASTISSSSASSAQYANYSKDDIVHRIRRIGSANQSESVEDSKQRWRIRTDSIYSMDDVVERWSSFD